MKDVLEVIEKRKSVRQYLDKNIPDEDLKKILEAGRLAPSWMNVQSWDFILVKSQKMKDILCNLSLGQSHVKNADALIVCVANLNAWEEAGITNIKNPALNPALQCNDGIKIRSLEQVIYPVSYMMLEAEALGISSCIIGAFGSEITGVLAENQKEAKEALSLKDWHIISTIITLGYEANPQPLITKTRKDFDEVVSLEHLGNLFK